MEKTSIKFSDLFLADIDYRGKHLSLKEFIQRDKINYIHLILGECEEQNLHVEWELRKEKIPYRIVPVPLSRYHINLRRITVI